MFIRVNRISSHARFEQVIGEEFGPKLDSHNMKFLRDTSIIPREK